MSRQRTRSSAQTVGSMLLLVITIRGVLDVHNLSCKAIAWLPVTGEGKGKE